MNTEIAKALLAVQQEAPTLQRDGINPHFHSSYVTLESLMSAVLPVLNKHGIVLIQAPTAGGELLTRLVHAESGEEMGSYTLLMQTKPNDPQAQGSAITYARRYALMAMLGLVADEDDDGAAAAAPPARRAAPAPSGAPSPGANVEFDPGKHILPGAIVVRTEEDADSLRRVLLDVDPEQPWNEIEEYVCLHLFEKEYEELEGKQKREFYTRFANAVVKLDELAGGGDFPPPTLDQVQAAWSWAFKGVTLALSEPLPDDEPEPEVSDTPELENPVDAPEEEE